MTGMENGVEADRAIADEQAPELAAPEPEDPGASDDPKCGICRESLRAQPVQMLACGHAWHSSCLQNAWRIGGHAEGWCPYRCDVRAAAQALEHGAPVASGESVDIDQEPQPAQADVPEDAEGMVL